MVKMTNKTDNLEIVYEGWLTKSPPTTRIWRARWRKRWFILRHSGELPGQYFLCYYTDRNCRKLKGQIDLDQCEQVDAGLRFENRKLRYQFMFNIRTPKRTYFLAAENETDMNKWVDCICHVCGLKPVVADDTNNDCESDASTRVTSLDEPSPKTPLSGPYIPISECISGKPINTPDELREFMLLHDRSIHTESESYDLPRRLKPQEFNDIAISPPPSPGSESVFTDDESVVRLSMKKPAVNWETFPRPSDSSLEDESTVMRANRRFTRTFPENGHTVPPRPPKPPHLSPIDNVENESPVKTYLDETYDIPRSHQLSNSMDEMNKSKDIGGRHSYTNAAPCQVTGNVFRYDFDVPVVVAPSSELPESPRSETSSITLNTMVYSNLPSPSPSMSNQIVSTPPAVNRELKPGRKCSDSTGGSNEPSPLLPFYPPNVDRKLKPAQLKKIQEALHVSEGSGELKLCSPPAGSLGRRKQRMAPSPTPPSTKNLHNNNNGYATTGRMHRRYSSSDDRLPPKKEESGLYQLDDSKIGTYDENKRFDEIQYLDLDLECSEIKSTLISKGQNQTTSSTATVYKTVDFLKTDAFNRTRIEVEEKRNRLCM